MSRENIILRSMLSRSLLTVDYLPAEFILHRRCLRVRRKVISRWIKCIHGAMHVAVFTAYRLCRSLRAVSGTSYDRFLKTRWQTNSSYEGRFGIETTIRFGELFI